MSNRRYGKLPPRHDPRRLRLTAYTTAALPAPPASDDRTYGITEWGMMGNDAIGDCTCAEFGHQLMAWTMGTTGKPLVLPDAAIVGAYSAITGYDPATGANDNGAVIVDALEYQRTIGFGGDKITAWAALDRTQLAISQGIHYFGGVNIGINLPQSAEDQADRGLAWTTPWFSPIVGGHCIPLLSYNQNFAYCITWGKIQAMTWDFFFRYCDEAYVVLAPYWFGADGNAPIGLNVAALTADLQAISTAA